MREKVESNVYYIPERIREINENYVVYYNHGNKKFEIHDKNRTLNRKSFVMSLPFSELDPRCIDYINKTIRENQNLEIMLRDMRKHNDKIEASADKKASENSKDALRDCLSHIQHNPSKFL